VRHRSHWFLIIHACKRGLTAAKHLSTVRARSIAYALPVMTDLAILYEHPLWFAPLFAFVVIELGERNRCDCTK